MHTIHEINQHFAAGNATVTLTAAEWQSIREVVRTYSATGSQLQVAQRETERVKRIARPVWRACRIVAEQIRRSRQRTSRVSDDLLADWERRLRLAMEIDRKDSVPFNVPFPPASR